MRTLALVSLAIAIAFAVAAIPATSRLMLSHANAADAAYVNGR